MNKMFDLCFIYFKLSQCLLQHLTVSQKCFRISKVMRVLKFPRKFHVSAYYMNIFLSQFRLFIWDFLLGSGSIFFMLSQMKLHHEWLEEVIKQKLSKRILKIIFPVQFLFVHSTCNFPHVSRKINAIYIKLLKK